MVLCTLWRAYKWKKGVNKCCIVLYRVTFLAHCVPLCGLYLSSIGSQGIFIGYSQPPNGKFFNYYWIPIDSLVDLCYHILYGRRFRSSRDKSLLYKGFLMGPLSPMDHTKCLIPEGNPSVKLRWQPRKPDRTSWLTYWYIRAFQAAWHMADNVL